MTIDICVDCRGKEHCKINNIGFGTKLCIDSIDMDMARFIIKYLRGYKLLMLDKLEYCYKRLKTKEDMLAYIRKNTIEWNNIDDIIYNITIKVLDKKS